jgi:hypothetical protein
MAYSYKQLSCPAAAMHIIRAPLPVTRGKLCVQGSPTVSPHVWYKFQAERITQHGHEPVTGDGNIKRR